MLIHHFEAETQGFQRLVYQNDEESLNPPKITFSERNIFSGGSLFHNFSEHRLRISQCISLMKIFLFLM